MIEQLTEDQEKRMEEISSIAIQNSNGGNTNYDIPKITEWIYFLYEKSDIPIIICSSPDHMFKEANKLGYRKKKGETFDWLGIGFDSGWTTHYEFMEEIGVNLDDIPDWRKWKILKDSGVWATLLFENVAFVCIRPTHVKTNINGDLHCRNGMAIDFVDGTGYYFLNGVPMEEKHIITPAEKLNVLEIINEKNIEVRRELIRKIGIERFILKTGATVLDKNGDYELLSIKLSDEVPDARYLKMKNPSIATWHVEGVEGNTVEEAINWRSGDIKENGIQRF